MRGAWGIALVFVAVAVVVAFVYALAESGAQMRALFGGAPVVAPEVSGPAAPPSDAAVALPPTAESPARDVAAPAGDDDVADDGIGVAGAESAPAEGRFEDSAAGPPSGAEFSALLEAELAGEADDAAAEALRRVLREEPSSEQ